MSKVDVKVVLLGQHDVGKTCLVDRYLHGKFKVNVTATVGAAFGARKVELPGSPAVTLGIWDTAGAERYESMSRIYYRAARAAIVCFDLTNSASWPKVKFWIEELTANEENCDIYIVGTKMDKLGEGCPRGVSADIVEQFAQQYHADVFETSAKTGENINEVFNKVARDFLRKKTRSGTTSRDDGIQMLAPPGGQAPGKTCCGQAGSIVSYSKTLQRV